MLAVAIALGLLAFAMRVCSTGWSTLLFGPLDGIVIMVHWALTLVAAKRPFRGSVVVLSLAASVWLTIVIGLQVDFGDGGNPWFVFMSLFFDRLPETNLVPDWWPFREPLPFAFDFAALASIIVPWMLIVRLLPPKEQITET